MSYAGSVADMIQKIRMNRQLQIKNRGRLIKAVGRTDIRELDPIKFNREKYPLRSNLEIELSREIVRKEMEKERRMHAIKVVIGVMIVLSTLFFIAKLNF